MTAHSIFKSGSAALLLCLSLVLGFEISRSGFGGTVAVSALDFRSRNGRIPAGSDLAKSGNLNSTSGDQQRRVADVSALDVFERDQSDFVRLATWKWSETSAAVALIRFAELALVSSVDQKRRLSCTEFNRVDLRFVAEGMASAGLIPELVVSAPCVSSEDMSWTQPIEIPFGAVHERPAEDGALVLAQYPDHQFIAKNVLGVWPTTWSLRHITLRSDSNSDADLNSGLALGSEASGSSDSSSSSPDSDRSHATLIITVKPASLRFRVN